MSKLLNPSLLIAICFVAGSIHAQNNISSVDFSQIKYKSVKNYIVDQQNRQIEYFSDMEASVQSQTDLSYFMNYEKEYIIKESSDVVWENYRHSNQVDIWELRRVAFGVLYSRENQSLVYADQDFYGMEVGQIYYLNLKVLNGLYKLPVVFEIITVDPEKKLFEFSYLKGGTAQGKQMIQFEDTEEGYTRIVHKSFVKSHSKIRDMYIYPFFHNKIIKEFHDNMRRTIAENMKHKHNMLVKAN